MGGGTPPPSPAFTPAKISGFGSPSATKPGLSLGAVLLQGAQGRWCCVCRVQFAVVFRLYISWIFCSLHCFSNNDNLLTPWKNWITFSRCTNTTAKMSLPLIIIHTGTVFKKSAVKLKKFHKSYLYKNLPENNVRIKTDLLGAERLA